jgi:hypothetical protein
VTFCEVKKVMVEKYRLFNHFHKMMILIDFPLLDQNKVYLGSTEWGIA